MGMRWDQVVDALIEARKREGISVTQLARALGVVRGSIYNWEGLKNRPSIEQLQSWCEAVGLGLSFEVHGAQEKTSDEVLMEAFAMTADAGAIDAVRRLMSSYIDAAAEPTEETG